MERGRQGSRAASGAGASSTNRGGPGARPTQKPAGGRSWTPAPTSSTTLARYSSGTTSASRAIPKWKS
eukprot:8234157-Alexandrium_andersonii.AAC.1